MIKFKHFGEICNRRLFSTNLEKRVLKNVTFFGGDMFAVSILSGVNELVKKNLIKNLNVITCDNGRENERIKKIKRNHVIDYCKENKIEFHFWEQIRKDFQYEKFLVEHDLGIVASFANLLPNRLIKLYK